MEKTLKTTLWIIGGLFVTLIIMGFGAYLALWYIIQYILHAPNFG